MPFRGLILDGEPYELENIPPHVLMPELVTYLQKEKDRSNYHLTDLTMCPNYVARQKKYEYYLPVGSLWHLVRGQAWDTFVAANPSPGSIYHKTFHKNLLGIDIEGTPDVIRPEPAIEDTKAPAWMQKEPVARESYQIQLNGYVWITEDFVLERFNRPVQRLALNLCGPMDFVHIPVSLWLPNRTLDILKYKLDDLQVQMNKSDVGICDNKKCFGCYPREKVLWL